MARILIVDDSPIIHQLLTRKLSDSGHQVVGHAADGNEAVVKFKECGPDLVLMDVTMPSCDGKQGLKQIIAQSASAKVLMLSALTEPELIQECLRIGACGYLSKERLSEHGYLESEVNKMLDALRAV